MFSLQSLGDLFGGMLILFINHMAGEDCYCRPLPLPPTPLGPTIAGPIVPLCTTPGGVTCCLVSYYIYSS